MSVKIGSARIDENGKAHGGKAGDQTGKEVSTQNWYKHTKGWVVLRPKSNVIADLIASDMEYACKNPNIGYDQYERNTLYNVAEKVGFNCSLVDKKCETDCSALVRVCCAYAGIRVSSFRTTNEVKILMATGYFEELTESKYTDSSNYLKRGDILVTKTQGHTVVVLNDGSKAESDVKTDKKYVIVTGDTVWIRTGPSTSFKQIGLAKKGDKYKYAGVTSNDGWNEIYFNNDLAWISGKFSKLE